VLMFFSCASLSRTLSMSSERRMVLRIVFFFFALILTPITRKCTNVDFVHVRNLSFEASVGLELKRQVVANE
jgi:hypothetical protein